MNQFAKPGLAEEKLPPVGSTDNGKVLGVSEGAWAKVAAPSGLPEVGADDKDKYLHTNASTGEPEWASGGGSGGGGVLIVGVNKSTNTLDKTWQEIFDADFAILHYGDETVKMWSYISDVQEFEGSYIVTVNVLGSSKVQSIGFTTDSADGYPSTNNGNGNGNV